MDTRSRFPRTHLRSILVALGVSVLALVVAQFALVPAVLIDPKTLEDPTQASRTARTALLAFNFVGIALGGLIYLWVSGRGTGWIDLHLPDKGDLVWMVAGFLILIGFYLLVGVLSTVLNLPAADSEIVLYLQDDVAMVLIMIAIVLFLNAPAEEFVFRNIVQKRLYQDFPGMQAIVITSIIFLLVHVPTFMTLAESSLATVVSLLMMFGGSVIFGTIYLRTENLLVPIVVHGGYNSLILLMFLASIIYDLDPAGQAVSGLIALVSGGAL